MKASVYTRPNKPKFISRRRRDVPPLQSAPALQKPVVVHKGTECHVTRADIAARMVEYLQADGNYNTLEPSAGTGALVSALLQSGHSSAEICAVELHHELAAQVRRLSVPVIQECFLEYAERVRGKVEFPRIIMNPPFSKVRAHIRAALSLLGRNGHATRPVLVALVPVTFEHEGSETVEHLPDDAFAACKVRTKIIRIVGA
ncbi:methyltransferase type 11 [Roseibium sp. RKSG952]|uniref:methyltransferase type 11 n=1 Tax=Roseibium sp. RKSG952 TaxID=2529384 RepID=UPI0012BC2696|nr:methyltransferase type 11 [Roseibium sp. RKSG952]MTH94944.1 methyltransferase type 11 [Roseibium sp. RKSG952]